MKNGLLRGASDILDKYFPFTAINNSSKKVISDRYVVAIPTLKSGLPKQKRKINAVSIIFSLKTGRAKNINSVKGIRAKYH
jgi:hypothetical protein